MKSYRDARLQKVRILLGRARNPEHAAFHKGYHKSSKKFYGLKAAELTDIFRSIFPKKDKIPKEEALILTQELWASDWFEEQTIGIMLLEQHAKELVPADLPYLKKMIGGCEGWATLDLIATKILGVLAINYGDPVYSKVRTWTKSRHLWTRRAAILIHVLPARKKKLNAEYALGSFEELLHENDFFIRKAIGWTLREMCRYYPEMVFEFLRKHAKEASGLT
ncbi:MAG: DNA alkylation repair protein, partial [Bacteroidota bacterium]|nr:DNA alkylation repair protein [Bacteroidota bacterium]